MPQDSESLVSYLDALASLRARAVAGRSPERENLHIVRAVGRIAAENLVSAEKLPPFANSAVDGFAVRAVDVPQVKDAKAAPVKLRGLGTIAAGDAPKSPAKAVPGTCWEIMTGAPMPAGYDAAVKIEDVVVHRRDGGAFEIELTGPVNADDFVREAGEDFRPGMPVISVGRRVRPEHVLAAASLGFEHVSVYAVPKVLVVSTGKELAAPGMAVAAGQIRNSTAPYLMGALGELGADVSFAGAVGDEPSHFIELFRTVLASKPDIVITTGAVSMGKHDFIPSALLELGAEIVFHKIAVRPGKPVLFATFKDGPVVFALPGNPVSTATGVRFLIEPYLRAWFGVAPERPARVRLAQDQSKPRELRVFLKAVLEDDQVRPLQGQASFMVSPLLEATGWIVLPEGRDTFTAGDTVEYVPLRSQ